MLSYVTHSLDGFDRLWSRAFALRSRAPHLLVALFHAIATQAGACEVLAAEQAVVLDDIRRFFETLLTAGYQPLSLHDLEQPSSWGSKRFLVTFDDGYFNNAAVLPVLEEFAVPAAFFISTGHVRQGKAFWWDVAARAARRQGACGRQVRARLEWIKQRPAAEIEQDLIGALGANAFRPVSDQDRPFSEGELKDFARSKWVTLGNHTADHTILTRCSESDAITAIVEGQRHLEDMTGIRPRAIAYPDGAFSPAVIEAAKRTGHTIGFTCVPKANAFPLRQDTQLAIGRHIVGSGRNYAEDIGKLAMPSVLPGARLRACARRVIELARRPVKDVPLVRPARRA